MLTIATGKEVALLLFHTPTKYGSDRFRQIFIDHWAQWWDYRQEEIPADQRAYVQKMVEIWEPQRHYIWMKRWPETHRRHRAARELLKRLQAIRPKKAQQLAFGFL